MSAHMSTPTRVCRYVCAGVCVCRYVCACAGTRVHVCMPAQPQCYGVGQPLDQCNPRQDQRSTSLSTDVSHDHLRYAQAGWG